MADESSTVSAAPAPIATATEAEAPDKVGDYVVLGVMAFLAGWFQIALAVAAVKGGLNLFTLILVAANIGLFWIVYVMARELYPDKSAGQVVGRAFAAEAVSLVAIMGPIAAVAWWGSRQN